MFNGLCGLKSLLHKKSIPVLKPHVCWSTFITNYQFINRQYISTHLQKQQLRLKKEIKEALGSSIHSAPATLRSALAAQLLHDQMIAAVW